MRTKILVIDDEEPICEILKFNLEKEGYEVDCAFSAEQALNMDLASYQLFICDIMMDKLSGFDFAKRVKNNPVLEPIPIIFCSALTGEDETVMGLNIGADDYITKPFTMPQVLARVRAVLRRVGITTPNSFVGRMTPQAMPAAHVEKMPSNPQPIVNNVKEEDIEFKTIKINQDEKTCYLDGKPIKLTKTEYNLLVFFLTHRNKIFSRDELIKNVWRNDVIVSNRAIDTNITRLRNKIGEYGSHIVTRTGFGYGFQEEV